MIPNKVIITGFKRFKETTVYLDRHLLAFIGANEAGKSSFLEALLSIENKTPYERNQLTNNTERDGSVTIVRVEYLITKPEIEKLKEFNGIGNPRYYCLWKSVDGGLSNEIIGDIKRNKSLRKSTSTLLKTFLKNYGLKKLIENNYNATDETEKDLDKKSLKDFIEYLKTGLNEDVEDLPIGTIQSGENILSILQSELKYDNKSTRPKINSLIDHITKLLKLEHQDHPSDMFLEYCDEQRPMFILFSDDKRHLNGNYSLKELVNPPDSISNLMSVSEVTISEFLNTININDKSERLKLMDIANDNLKAKYCSAWSQTDVFPRLLFDLNSINIQIISSGNYTEIISRSDGLKQFIALKAFLALNHHEIPPVLLIDEAEIHLHYAAQSDLIKEFERQDIVNSIIYTTHSAGCLPSDLGTGIRAIEQILSDGLDSGESKIKKSIWQNSGGFSSILFAMGANIIAFTMARKAVIAEGPSETVLLPRLFREAANLSYLDFQIAPGIATISKENVSSFELEAAKEVYLVDGDKGGNANKRKLISGGIASDKIYQLDKGYSVEDFVNTEVLIEAVNREFSKSGKEKIAFSINKLPKLGRINWIEKQCVNKGYTLPSKVRIAENITRNPSDTKIIDVKMKLSLNKIYKAIKNKLDK